jgi:hypothetical protein
MWSVKRGGLPAECGELARDGDRDDAGGLAPLVVQVLPARVEALLGAPRDRDDARVLAVLAAGEGDADGGWAAVVVRGLDEQPAGVRRAGLGDRALAALGVRGALWGDDAQEARQPVGVGEAGEAADLGAQSGRRRLSMPRKQRNRAITGAWLELGSWRSSATARFARRPISSSTAAR